MSAPAEPAVTVRAARPADVPTICRFIAGLAAYERLEHQLDLDEVRLHEHLFGDSPVCGALIAEIPAADNTAENTAEPIGFALYFQTYSTFRMRPCMHLEDLFVDPAHRGKGAGLSLLQAVAAEARACGCPRLDWNVLDWNTAAIEFYEQHGAKLLPDWRVCRLEL